MMPVYEYSLAEAQKYTKYSALTKQGVKDKAQKLKEEKKNILGGEAKYKKLQEQKREDQLKEQMGYFRNKVLDKSEQKQFRNDNNEDELDGFLNAQEISEIKRNYGDYNFADIIIQFPNPGRHRGRANHPIGFLAHRLIALLAYHTIGLSHYWPITLLA